MALIIESEKRFVDFAIRKGNENNNVSDVKFLAFLVKKPDSNEYLYRHKMGTPLFEWCKVPNQAKRFTRLKKAQELCQDVGDDVQPAMLLESQERYMTLLVSEEYE